MSCNRLRENLLAPRQHGNLCRLPSNTISFPHTQRVVEFRHTYAEGNALLLPGRIPGYKRKDVQLLPSSTTNVRCGSSIVHHLPAALTIKWHTPPSVPFGDDWCLTSWQRPLFDMSIQQHCHRESCQSTRGAEISCK